MRNPKRNFYNNKDNNNKEKKEIQRYVCPF